jgi:hypothetical protein
VLIRVLSYGRGFTLFVEAVNSPRRTFEAPCLREYLSLMHQNPYVVVKEQSKIGFNLITILYKEEKAEHLVELAGKIIVYVK